VNQRADRGSGAEDTRPPAEVLDLGVVGEPATPLDGPEPVGSRPLPRRVLLGAGGLLVAGAAGVAAWRGSASRPWTSPLTPDIHPPVEVTHLPRPVPGTDWDLFALGEDVVLRIHLPSGRVTRTQIPAVGDGEVSLVPVRRHVLIRPVGEGPCCVVPDDGRPVVMPPSLAGVGGLLPGPDPDHVWTEATDGQMALVTVDGRRDRVVVPVPEFATTGPMTDGAGGLLFEGIGGLYQVSTTGRMQVSDAILLAVGPGALLTLEHDARGRWHTLLRSHDGRGRTLPVSIGPQLPHGVLAPDGATVVLYVLQEPVSVALALVDLAPGVAYERRVHELPVTVGAGSGTVVWSPDGRRLVSVDALGRLTLIDPATRAVGLLDPDMPAVRQLAVRVA
jgi:hypothetical protein